MTDPLVFPWVVAVFGLMIGSFLNVCIYRLPRHESVVFPPSHCTRCGKAIAWYHNLPIVGWLVLRGRCASCGDRISIIYPLVEALTGAVFALNAWWFGPTPLLLVRLLFSCVLIVLAFIDIEHRILPNRITLSGIVVGFLASVWLLPGWRSSLIGILIGGGVLWAIGELYFRLRGVEGMGMGDVKMLAMIGAFLGWRQVIVVLFLSSFAGAVIGLALIALAGRSKQTKLPFGTFLALAAFAASLVGDRLLSWYLGLYAA